MSYTRERTIERSFTLAVGRRGGWAIKLNPQWVRGIPDRLVLYRGRAWFVELKTESGRLSKVQRAVHRRLTRLGFDVAVLWSVTEAENWIVENLDNARDVQAPRLPEESDPVHP